MHPHDRPLGGIATARPASRPADPGFSLLPRLAAWVGQRLEVARQRRALARLDDRLLRDIGLSRVDALREAGKPFWRP